MLDQDIDDWIDDTVIIGEEKVEEGHEHDASHADSRS